MSRKGSRIRRAIRRMLYHSDVLSVGCRHLDARLTFPQGKPRIDCRPCGSTLYTTWMKLEAAMVQYV